MSLPSPGTPVIHVPLRTDIILNPGHTLTLLDILEQFAPPIQHPQAGEMRPFMLSNVVIQTLTMDPEQPAEVIQLLTVGLNISNDPSIQDVQYRVIDNARIGKILEFNFPGEFLTDSPECASALHIAGITPVQVRLGATVSLKGSALMAGIGGLPGKSGPLLGGH
jgi:hypothetical protein